MSWNLGKDKVAIVKVDSIDVYSGEELPTVTGALCDKLLFGDISDFRNYFNSPQWELDSNSRLQCSYDKYFRRPLMTGCNAAITDVIFNDPATIVFWSDGDKTIVKATDEKFDKEKGLAMAIAKKLYGYNKGNYYNIFRQYCGEVNRNDDYMCNRSDSY